MNEDRCPVVAVVGGGFCGTVTAIHLLRGAAPGTRVTVIERSGDVGPGIAYATRDERHLLNVPVARMSAFPDAPSDFADWSGLHPAAYAPRRRYGNYLRARLAAAAAASAGSLERVTGEAVALRPGDGRELALELGDGRVLACDRVVLALGWPRGASGCGLPDDPRIVADPWAPGALDATGTTVVVGTGPTAVDVALSLCGASRAARVTAVSRSGRLPYAHLPGLRAAAPAPRLPAAPIGLDALEERLRRHAARMALDGYDWRDVVDGLRPHTPALWARLSLADRRRFVGTRARRWEVRRHRLAPQVAGTIAALRLSGRLTVASGGVADAAVRRGRLVLRLGDGRTLEPDRVIACTGAGATVGDCDDRLIRQLVADGLAVPDALAIGLRTAADGALIDGSGGRHERIWLLGPLRRGELWESTAVRELREQAASVARAVGASLAPAPALAA